MSFTLPAFVKDAGERAIKAFAGAVLATLGASAVDILHTDWEAALSVGGGAALVSVLMSLGSLTIANTVSPASVVKSPAPAVPATDLSDVRAQIADIRDAMSKVFVNPAPVALEPLPAGAALLPPGPQFGTASVSVPGVNVNQPAVVVPPVWTAETVAAAVDTTPPKPLAETLTPDVAPRKSRVFVTPKAPVVAPVAPPATKPVPEALAAAWAVDAAKAP